MKTVQAAFNSAVLFSSFIFFLPATGLAACSTQSDSATVCVGQKVCTCSVGGTSKRYYFTTTGTSCTPQNPGDTCGAPKAATAANICSNAQSLTKELSCGDGCENDGKQLDDKKVSGNCCTFTKTQKCKSKTGTPTTIADLIDPVCAE